MQLVYRSVRPVKINILLLRHHHFFAHHPFKTYYELIVWNSARPAHAAGQKRICWNFIEYNCKSWAADFDGVNTQSRSRAITPYSFTMAQFLHWNFRKVYAFINCKLYAWSLTPFTIPNTYWIIPLSIIISKGSVVVASTNLMSVGQYIYRYPTYIYCIHNSHNNNVMEKVFQEWNFEQEK